MAERLADKYEEAKEKQEDIMNRWVQTTLFHHRLLAVNMFVSMVEEHSRWESASLVCWKSELLKFPLLNGDLQYWVRLLLRNAVWG